MTRKVFEPRNLIVHYCFAMVLSGCVGVSLNRQMFESENHATPSVEVTAEATTAPSEVPQPTPAQNIYDWEGCPDHKRVLESVKLCRHLLAKTVKLTKALNSQTTEADGQAVEVLMSAWKQESNNFKIKNDSRLVSCGYLLGATGVEVFPELPLALENLKRAGTWLDWAVVSQQFGETKDSAAYIASANRAIVQANKLVTHRIKPRKTAVVQLPKTLEKLSISSL